MTVWSSGSSKTAQKESSIVWAIDFLVKIIITRKCLNHITAETVSLRWQTGRRLAQRSFLAEWCSTNLICKKVSHFLTHCQFGMVIYCSQTLDVLFRKAHRRQLTDRTFTRKELGEETDVKVLGPLFGTLLTSWTNTCTQTNLIFITKSGSPVPPTHSQYNILHINIHKPVTFSACSIRP